MTICSRTKGYCFQDQYAIVLKNNRLSFSHIVFLLFCNLKIPKQGIKMQFFFLNGLWKLLKNGHLPVKLTFKCPPPPTGNREIRLQVEHGTGHDIELGFHNNPFKSKKVRSLKWYVHLISLKWGMACHAESSGAMV